MRAVVEATPATQWLVSLRVTDLDWARRLVLGLGPEVTVVAPAELAEQVRRGRPPRGARRRTRAPESRHGVGAGGAPAAPVG